MHLFDPHDPYDPPADLKRRFAAAPYDGEIAAVDRLVGRLLQAAAADTIVAIAADHGEALGDHGEDTHGVFLYDAVLHVPLVVRLPGRERGQRASTRACASPIWRRRCSRRPVCRSRRPCRARRLTAVDRRSPPVYAETEYPRRAFGWSPLAAWRDDRFLLVRAPKPELYDLVADPKAAKNLAGTRERVVDGMAGELEQFLRRSLGGTDAPRPGAEGRSGAGGTAGGARLRERIECAPAAPAWIPRIASRWPTRCTTRWSRSRTAPFKKRYRCSSR